jgi:hypothetical protein
MRAVTRFLSTFMVISARACFSPYQRFRFFVSMIDGLFSTGHHLTVFW